jgi:hypothetical protein
VSAWFSHRVQDPDLADRIHAIEATSDANNPEAGSAGALRLIGERYTVGG